MMLSDMGADVVRIERADGDPGLPLDPTHRGRFMLLLDLKQSDDLETCRAAMERADVLIEGYRPGVMERLGLGPDEALRRNPQLVYGRMTGWGQTGPMAQMAGHDINYIALSGALHALGRPGWPPPPPLNLLGDFGGGAMYLAFGILAALYERQSSGRGQVIDAAMVDGVASLMAVFHGMLADRPDALNRGNLSLSGCAPNYRCYECLDGEYVAVGCLEPRFFTLLLDAVGSSFRAPPFRPHLPDWDDQIAELAQIFRTRTRQEWTELFAGTNACVVPVLSLAESWNHPHMVERGTYVTIDGHVEPAPAPRFSRTPGAIRHGPHAGQGTGRARLAAWGVPVSLARSRAADRSTAR
jgi:alpha-methylacyl-CoA racemase